MNQDAFDKAAAVVLQEARARLTKKAAGGSWSPGGPTMDYNPDEFNLTAMDPPKPAAGPVRGLPAPAKAMPAPAAPGRAGFGNFLGRFGGLLSRGGLGGGLARLGTGLAAGAGLNALNNYMRPGPVKAGGDVMFGPEDNPERPGESTMTKVLGLPAGLLSAAAVPAGIAGGRYSPPLTRVGKPLVGGALATGAATGLGWLIDKIRNYRYKGSSPAAPVEFGPPEHPSRPGEHTYRNWLGGLGLLGLTPVGGIAGAIGGHFIDKSRNQDYQLNPEQWHGASSPEKAAHALLQEARYRLAVKQADMDPALRNALLGAALGGGAGFAYDRLARDPKDRNGLGSAIAGAGLGAAGGAASPAIADALAGALGGSAAGGLTGAVGGAVTGNELRRSGLPASIAAPGGAMAGAPVGGVIGGATGALTGGAIGGLSGFANAAQQDHAGAELLGNALGGLVLGGGGGAAHEMTKDKKDRNLLRGAVRGGAIGAAGTAAGTGIGRMLAGGLGGAAGGAVGGGIAGTAAGGVMGGIAGSASDQDILEARAQLERTLQQYRTQHGS